MATSESWKDKSSGEKQEKTEWHRVTIWNQGLAGVAEQYLKKGSRVFLSGQLETRKWADKDGVERYSTEIVLRFNAELVLLDGKGAGGGRDFDSEERERGQPAVQGAAKSDLDDEIPF